MSKPVNSIYRVHWSKHSHISAIFDNAFQSRAGSPDVYMSMRSAIVWRKKDGSLESELFF